MTCKPYETYDAPPSQMTMLRLLLVKTALRTLMQMTPDEIQALNETAAMDRKERLP